MKPFLLAVCILLAGAGARAAERDACTLTDVAQWAGLTFRHLSGASERRHLPETMGAGLAWLDYDGDGWLDLYLVQSGSFPPTGTAGASNRLFRNLGDGRFVEAPDPAGAPDRGYGQGVVAVDAEGDGDMDLVVANFGTDTLWLNRGDGTFDGAVLGAADFDPATAWSSSLAAGDLDRDGDLDLYVSRYMEYDPAEELFCGDSLTGERSYCDPSLFVGAADSIFRQTESGYFLAERLPVPQSGALGRGLGALIVDLDGDLLPEVYVSNDLDPNTLWRFADSGVAQDRALVSGAGVNREGRPEAGMGLAVIDGDRDGDPDLFVANFDVETNTYYENLGGLLFEDVASKSGLGPASLNSLGFGVLVADFDRDGREDLYVANGHIFRRPKRDNVSYAQFDQLFWGTGAGRFELADCPALSGRATVSRGAGRADYDNDGDPDVAIQENDGPFRLLRNDASAGEWLGLRLEGGFPNTQGVGAVVRGSTREHSQARWVIAGDSYQSSSDRRVLMAAQRPLVRVEVIWPLALRWRLVEPPMGRYLVVPEGSGSGAKTE